MRTKFTRAIPVLFAVAALGAGGSAAIAMAGTNGPAEPVSTVDTDNVQQQVGNQNAPDTTTSTAETTSTVDADNIQQQVGNQNAPDTTTGAQNDQGGGQSENQQSGGNDPAGGFEGTANYQGDFQGQQ